MTLAPGKTCAYYRAEQTSGRGVFMDFEEAEHLMSIRRTVREICADFDDGYWRDHDSRHEFPWEFYEALAKGGWVGVAIPEEYGGGGGGITEASVVVEEVA